MDNKALKDKMSSNDKDAKTSHIGEGRDVATLDEGPVDEDPVVGMLVGTLVGTLDDEDYDSQDEDNPKLTSAEKAALIEKTRDRETKEIDQYLDHYEGKDVPIKGEPIMPSELNRYIDDLKIDKPFVTIIDIDSRNVYSRVPKEKIIPYVHIFTHVDAYIYYDRVHAYAKRNKILSRNVSRETVKVWDTDLTKAWESIKKYEESFCNGKVDCQADEQLIVTESEW